jgi:hypothetical protein
VGKSKPWLRCAIQKVSEQLRNLRAYIHPLFNHESRVSVLCGVRLGFRRGRRGPVGSRAGKRGPWGTPAQENLLDMNVVLSVGCWGFLLVSCCRSGWVFVLLFGGY